MSWVSPWEEEEENGMVMAWQRGEATAKQQTTVQAVFVATEPGTASQNTIFS